MCSDLYFWLFQANFTTFHCAFIHKMSFSLHFCHFLCAYAIWTLVLYWKILFGEQTTVANNCSNSIDTGCKLTVQKRFTRCSGCLLNVLRAFNLCLAYMGKAYFCNKLIFESCSNASASCIYLSFLISAWLETTVSIVSAVFCRRICQRISDNLLSHEQQLNKTTFVSHLMSGESMFEKLVKLMQD